jgi:hypothetical protein
MLIITLFSQIKAGIRQQKSMPENKKGKVNHNGLKEKKS